MTKYTNTELKVSGISVEDMETVKDSNNLSCDLCKVVMELLDAFITDEVTEEQVRRGENVKKQKQ